MRYAEYGGPARQQPPADSAEFTFAIDRIRDAVSTNRYWAYTGRPDGTWVLCHLDDTTGNLTAPVEISPPLTTAADRGAQRRYFRR